MPSQPPKWIKPQLTHLVDEPPAGADWLHEVKYDGYRMHAHIDGGNIQLLTQNDQIGRIDIAHRCAALAEGEVCLPRRRALRAERGWPASVQPATGGNG